MNTRPTSALIESLFNQSKEYAVNRLDLLKLKSIDKTSSVASAVITGVVLFVVFFIFFVVVVVLFVFLSFKKSLF